MMVVEFRLRAELSDGAYDLVLLFNTGPEDGTGT